MLIDEFAELRIWAGETARLEREREHARRAAERGHRQRPAAEQREARAGRHTARVVPAAPAPEAEGPVVEAVGDPVGAAAEPERELARAVR